MANKKPKKREHWWLIVNKRTGVPAAVAINGRRIQLIGTRAYARELYRAAGLGDRRHEIIKVVRA